MGFSFPASNFADIQVFSLQLAFFSYLLYHSQFDMPEFFHYSDSSRLEYSRVSNEILPQDERSNMPQNGTGGVSAAQG